MALYPPAIKKLIPPGANDPRIKACGMVEHVRDGLGASLYDYFNGPSGGVESHFYIRFDGTVEQYRDTDYEADANLDGNSFMRGSTLYGLLSTETEGLADGKWTEAQIEAMKKLDVWAAETHGFPLKLIDAWNGNGIGYHTMWGAPSHWTPVSKTCPGPNRIIQFKTILVPWMNAGGHLENPWPGYRTTSPAVGAMVDKLELNGYFRTGHRDRPNYYGAWTRGAIKNLQADFEDTKADPDGLIGPLTWAHIEALPDKPPPPPPPHKSPLADAWQRAQGDVGRAEDARNAAAAAFIAAHPNMPAYKALAAAQIARKPQTEAEWRAIYNLNH